MDKYDILVLTGRMEVKADGDTNILAEIKKLQKYVVDDDYNRFAVCFGRLYEIAKKSNTGIMHEMQKMLDYKPACGKADANYTKLNASIDVLDLTVRTFNLLKRSGVSYIRDFADDSSELLEKRLMHNSKAFEELVTKMRNYGIKNFPLKK